MTTPSQPLIGQDFYYDLALDVSPSTLRGRDAVPSGTVASRIRELQNLTDSSKPGGFCSPTSCPREKTRPGFGRRTETESCQPGSGFSKPDKEVHLTSKHSFLGLKTYRVNHLEEHAMVDGRVISDRTAGLHGKLQPSGAGATVQYEATNPLSVILKDESLRNSQQDCYNQGVDMLLKSCFENQLSSLTQLKSVLPSPACRNPEKVGIIQERSPVLDPKRHMATDQQKISHEGPSLKTDFTIHRQSVKDLYYHYGIQRPAGLLSSNITVLGTERPPQLPTKYRNCHMCFESASINASECECEHSFCKECECLESVPKCEGSLLRDEKVRSQSSDGETLKQTRLGQETSSQRPWQDSFHKRIHRRRISMRRRQKYRDQLNNTSLSLLLVCSNRTMPRCRSKRIPQECAEFSGSAKNLRQTIASETVTCIRKPSSPSADTFCTTYPPGTLPTGIQVSQVERKDLPFDSHHRPEYCYYETSRSNSSPNSESVSSIYDFDNCGGHATEQGYQPHQYSMIHTRKRRRYPEQTDSGYMAGTSHLEELEPPMQKYNQQSRSETLILNCYRPCKQHLSQCQDESDSPQGLTHPRKDSDFPHQNFYGAYETSPKNKVSRQESGPILSKSSRIQSSEKRLLGRTNILIRNEYIPTKRPKRSNYHGDKLNNSNLGDSDECKQDLSKYKKTQSKAAHKQTRHDLQDINTDTIPQIANSNASAGVDNLISVLEILEPRSKTPSDVVTSHQAEQLANAMSNLSFNLKMQSSDSLTDDTAIPFPNPQKQKPSRAQKSQIGHDVHYVKSDERKQKGLIKSPSKLSKYSYQLSEKNSNEDCIKMKPKASDDTPTAAAGTITGFNHPEHDISSFTELNSDTSPSVSVQRSEDLSSRKFQSASQRLPELFKLQEQNTVSFLKEQLQQHQDKLKGIEEMSDRKLKVAVQKLLLDYEQDHDVDRQESETKQELSKRSSETRPIGTDLQSLQEDEHACAYKRMVTIDKNGNAENQGLSDVDTARQLWEKDASKGEIRGITVLIHLEGKEDMVIKADTLPRRVDVVRTRTGKKRKLSFLSSLQ